MSNLSHIISAYGGDWNTITGVFKAHGINTIIDKRNNRIMFATKRQHINPPKYLALCIGEIYSGHGMNLVSYMPPRSKIITLKDVNEMNIRDPSKIRIYNIHDGSMIGLYWFKTHWVIRSLNGYDIGHMSFYGNKKYGNILRLIDNKYEGFSASRLDRNMCYTLSIKYSESHPFLEGGTDEILSAILVSCHKLIDNKHIKVDHTEVDIGIPSDMPIQRDWNPLELFEKSKNSLSNYLDSGDVLYGYIAEIDDVRYMIRGELMKYISKCFYTNKYNRLINQSGYVRREFLLVMNYLNYIRCGEHHLNVFKKMFPQFSETIAKIAEVYSDINADIYYTFVASKEEREKNKRVVKYPDHARHIYVRATDCDELLAGISNFVLADIHCEDYAPYIYSIVFRNKLRESQ